MLELPDLAQDIKSTRLRRYKSQKLVSLKNKNQEIKHCYQNDKLKYSTISRSNSKGKIIGSRLFSNAKKTDDKETYITKSTLSQQSSKFSNRLSGITKSASKKSLKNYQKLSINNVVSQVFIFKRQDNGHQLSRLIEQDASNLHTEKVPFYNEESSISIIQSIQLRLNSEILELDESTQNEINATKLKK